MCWQRPTAREGNGSDCGFGSCAATMAAPAVVAASENEADPCKQEQLPGEPSFDGQDEAWALKPCDVKQPLAKRQRQKALMLEKACCFGA